MFVVENDSFSIFDKINLNMGIAFGLVVLAIAVFVLLFSQDDGIGEGSGTKILVFLVIVLITIVTMTIFPMFLNKSKGENENTNKITEASSLNNEKFKNKIIETADIDSLQDFPLEGNDNYDYDRDIVKYFQEGGYLTTVGKKDGEKLKVTVFFKKDTMNITTQNDDDKDSSTLKEFEYTPKEQSKSNKDKN